MSLTISKTCNNALDSVKRFPVPTLLITIFCIISLMINHDIKINYHEAILKNTFWGTWIYISTTLFIERYNNKIVIYTLSIIISAITIFYLDNIQNILHFSFVCLNILLVLSIFVLPFIRNNISDIDIWKFDYVILLRACFSILISSILCCGIIGLMYSIEYLFNVNIPATLYRDASIIIFILFCPIFTITGIPLINTLSELKIEAKWLKAILVYALIPIFFAYTIVIHAYIIKALYTQILPSNISGYLASVFCVKSILIFMISTVWQQENSLIQLFRKYCAFSLIAPIILFILSLTVRINIYGITPFRYLGVMVILWIICSIFFILSNYKENAIKHISSTFLLILAFSSFGPWSIDNLPYAKQLHNLQSILSNHHMLVDSQFVDKKEHNFSKTEIIKIKESVRYITKYNRTSDVVKWFANSPNADIHKHPNYRNILNDLGIVNEE